MAQNLFQANTYESSMPSNLDELSPMEIEGLHSQIRFFGQCPVQLFNSSPQGLGHPQRQVRLINTVATDSGTDIEEKAPEELRQQLAIAQVEIERLNKEIADISSQNEANLQERIEEYRSLEQFHRKKLHRTKEEGTLHFDKLKLKVQELKQK